jgi:hypothetical protein
MALSDFGTLCTIAGVTLKVINVSPPAVNVGKIETTNHSSAAWREYIADGLKSLAEFTLTGEASAVNVAQLQAVLAGFAPVAVVFTEKNLPAWSFTALITQYKLSDANAQSPTEEIITVTIQPTGALTIAAAATAWDDDVVALFFLEGGAYTTAAHPTTHLMQLYAVIPGLPPHLVSAVEMADITFVSGTVGTATVAATGIITTVASGDTDLTAALVSDATIETLCVVTVP